MTIESLKAKHNSLPKYLSMTHVMKDHILTGHYLPNSRIPGERELAEQFGVSRVTVRQAIELLETEGYLKRKSGSGTFVNPFRNDGKPTVALTHMAFVFIDVSTSMDYNVSEISTAERWLAEHDITLSWASVQTEDLIAGKTPLILKKQLVQGLLLDGVVRDFHRVLAERHGLPYLILGSHDVSSDLPQVKYNFTAMARRATELLWERNPGQPILLLVEPFRLHYTRELLDGYTQAVQSLGADLKPVLETCIRDESYPILSRRLRQGLRHFSVLTTDRIHHGVLRAFRENNLSVRDNPIAVIGNPNRISEEDRRDLIFLPIRAEQIALGAVQTFRQMFEAGQCCGSVELDFTVEAPEGASV